MKLNWGWGIVIVLFLFIVFIVNLVYKCTQVNIDLVAENYYDLEIKYQEQIDRETNALNLETGLSIVQSENQVEIKFPPGFEREKLTGNIQFFRPDEADLDFSIEVKPDDENTQIVNTGNLQSGWWEVQVQWESGETEYYKAKKVKL